MRYLKLAPYALLGLASLAQGQSRIVCAQDSKAGNPVAVVTAYRKPGIARRPGLFKGKVTIHESFFEPMDDEFLQHFE